MRVLGAVARWIGAFLLWGIVAFLLAVTIVPRFLDREYYAGPVSGHFDGAHFFNPDEGEGEWAGDPTRNARDRGARRGSPSFLLRWIAGADERPAWPERVAVTQAKPRDLPPLKAGEMRATWVGHATVLIETPGLNILTDPIWSDVAGPFGIGPHRVAQPGIAFDDLPRIDLVVVSHAHYDHMDLATLKRLWQRDQPTIVTSLGNDAIIGTMGVKAQTLDWGAAMRIGNGRVTVTRNHHWSSRWGADRNRALWSSFVIDTPSGSIFFAGDTGPGDMRWPDEAKAAAAGPIRLAIIPIGAFRFAPGQMWSGSHVGPKQAVEIFRRLGAERGLPIHWGTFRLSWEAYDTPPKMLGLEMACGGIQPSLFTRQPIGQPMLLAANPVPPVALPIAPCNRAAIDALP